MESDRAAIGLLIIILLIVGANFLMYAIVRGWAKSGDSHWFSSLKDSLSKPMNTPANKAMDELRQRVEDLEKKHAPSRRAATEGTAEAEVEEKKEEQKHEDI